MPAAPAGLHPAAQVPPALPRPGGDPFGEPPEPRHSRGVAMDEKLEFFRTVVKQKEETLARARALYEQRDLEAARLREVAVALYAQAEEVLPLYGRLREMPAQLEQLHVARASRACPLCLSASCAACSCSSCAGISLSRP